MATYSQHTVDTAPEGSKPILSAIKGKMGFVPNLMATMAESPVLVESYMTMMGIFEKTDLTPTESEIILMTNNRLNGCTYCMAAHTAVSKMAGIDDSVIEALRAGTPIADPTPGVRSDTDSIRELAPTLDAISDKGRPLWHNEKVSNRRQSKPGVCFTANQPHTQTNRMGQSLCWIRAHLSQNP